MNLAPVTWVVQANLLNRRRQDNVAVHLKELGIPFVDVNVVSFSNDLTYLLEEPPHRRVIPYGSTALIRRGMDREWQGLFFDPKTFCVDTWLKNRMDLLNDSCHIMSVRAALRWGHNRTGMWHVRPNEDLKTFTGFVAGANEIADWLQGTESVQIDDGLLTVDTRIVISPEQEILAEWRWFIVDHRIVDGSMYRARGRGHLEHETDEQVIAEAQRLAEGWLPHPVCCMDTALTEKGLRVLEFNCFNGCGFYEHDLAKILPVVTDFVERHS